MGEGSLAALLWALTQTGEAAVDKQQQATGLRSSKQRRVKKVQRKFSAKPKSRTCTVGSFQGLVLSLVGVEHKITAPRWVVSIYQPLWCGVK